MRKTLERHRQLSIEVACLAGVGQERKSKGRVGRSLQDPMRGGTCPHRIARGERVLPFAKIVVRPREDDLDFADPAADDVGEAHEARTLDGRKGRNSGPGVRVLCSGEG